MYTGSVGHDGCPIGSVTETVEKLNTNSNNEFLSIEIDNNQYLDNSN